MRKDPAPALLTPGPQAKLEGFALDPPAPGAAPDSGPPTPRSGGRGRAASAASSSSAAASSGSRTGKAPADALAAAEAKVFLKLFCKRQAGHKKKKAAAWPGSSR